MTGDDATATVGETPTLACNVSTIPDETTVAYQWKRPDMTEIAGATSEMYQFSSPVGVSDAGVYTCEATVSGKGDSLYVTDGRASLEIALTITSK